MDPAKPPGTDTTYVWEIENFSMCPQSKEECLKSNSFYVDSIEVSEYQLVLYPRGRWYEKNDTAFCQLVCLQESDCTLKVSLTVNYDDLKDEKVQENVQLYSGETIGFPIELRKKSLVPAKFALLPGELFTIRCTISPIYRDPEADDVDLKTLSEDLGRLHQMGLFSDFCLVARGGRKFPVHKVILTERCPQLTKKLGIFKSEDCKKCEIDVTGEVLEVFLHYVYTGRLRENLPCDLLNGLYTMAVDYDMDDLHRDLFPVDLCTVGRTTIRVDHHDITWDLVDFHERVERGDWPVQTFLDLIIGRFVASFSIRKDDEAQVDLRCQCLNLDKSLVMKCVVRVLTPDEESRVTLCSGEHRFDADSKRFVMKGDCTALCKSVKEFPDRVALVLDIKMSNPRCFDQCNTVEIINALQSPQPFRERSLHRLSSDLDTLFEDTLEPKLDEDEDYSDLKVTVQGPTSIPVHRCILAARSGHLMSLIIGNAFLERTGEINMPDMGFAVARYMLRYVYSGKLLDYLTFGHVLAIYFNARNCQLKTLSSRCLQQLHLKVQLEDLINLMEHLKDQQLVSVAASFIRRERDLVFNSKVWADIEKWFPSRAALVINNANSSKMDF